MEEKLQSLLENLPDGDVASGIDFSENFVA